MEQYLAAKRLAERHDSVVFVRDVGGQTITATLSRGVRFETYHLNANGRATLVGSVPRRLRCWLIYCLTVISFFVCFGIYFLPLGEAISDAYGAALFLPCFALIVLSAIAGQQELGWHLRNESGGGDEGWVEVRPPDPELDQL
jgi:peptidoglycan/LPS O-acetylase OafA/YrhL